MSILELKKLAKKVGCTAELQDFYDSVCHTCNGAPAISCGYCAVGGVVSH